MRGVRTGTVALSDVIDCAMVRQLPATVASFSLGAFLVFALSAGCGKDTKDEKTNPDKTAPATTKSPKTADPPATAKRPDKAPGADKAGDKAGDKVGDKAGDKPAAAANLYFERKLEKDELRTRSLRELSLMRNTIFARGGNKFRKKWLREYFTAQPWYKPLDKLDKSKIGDTDWKNIKTIAEVERSFSKNQLIERKNVLLAEIGTNPPNPEQRVEMELISRKLGKWIGSKAEKKLSPLEEPSQLDNVLELSQLEDMSRKDLRLLRNTIYARHGYEFKSYILEDYFEFMDWYETNEKFTEKMLTKVDWKNIKLIKSVEAELGGPMSDNEHGEEIGWFDGA